MGKMSEFVIPNRIFDPASECMRRSDRTGLQATHLRRTVEQAQKIAFYRRKFAEKNITPDQIRTVDDLKRLPFTTKQDLREYYPFGFFAVPRGELARVHASSGQADVCGLHEERPETVGESVCALSGCGGVDE